MKKIIIQSAVRFVFGMVLVATIWYRVDWSVGLFAFFVLFRAELIDLNENLKDINKGLIEEITSLKNRIKRTS